MQDTDIVSAADEYVKPSIANCSFPKPETLVSLELSFQSQQNLGKHIVKEVGTQNSKAPRKSWKGKPR